MADRGRKAGFHMGAEHRTKIGNSKILKRLIGHAEGTVKMEPSQVTAAISLLDRVMPKMASVALTDADGGNLTINVNIGGDDNG